MMYVYQCEVDWNR